MRTHMLKRLDQKPSRPTGWVKDRLAKLGINLLHHEANQRPRGVELARVASCIPHLPEHRLVEVSHRVNVIARRKVNGVDFVHDIPHQIAREHSVVGLLEYRCDYVSWVVLTGSSKVSHIWQEVHVYELQ